jgi:hypothetical protein
MWILREQGIILAEQQQPDPRDIGQSLMGDK